MGSSLVSRNWMRCVDEGRGGELDKIKAQMLKGKRGRMLMTFWGFLRCVWKNESKSEEEWISYFRDPEGMGPLHYTSDS